MKLLPLIGILLVIVVAGCVATTPVATTGILEMKITDKPAMNITSLEVTISEIEVHLGEVQEQEREQYQIRCHNLGYGNGICRNVSTDPNVSTCLDTEVEINTTDECEANQTICCDTTTSPPEQAEPGWITFSTEEKTFDLIQIRDVYEILGNATLEAGKYTQIRLLVKEAVLTVDGEEKDIEVPSGKLKLIHPFDIVANETTTLLLDFDAEKSVVERGKTGKYNLKPTIKIITE